MAFAERQDARSSNYRQSTRLTRTELNGDSPRHIDDAESPRRDTHDYFAVGTVPLRRIFLTVAERRSATPAARDVFASAVEPLSFFVVAWRKLLVVNPLRLFGKRDPIVRQPLQSMLYGLLFCLRSTIFCVGRSLSVLVRP
jgi:hypothetical protein